MTLLDSKPLRPPVPPALRRYLENASSGFKNLDFSLIGTESRPEHSFKIQPSKIKDLSQMNMIHTGIHIKYLF